MFLHVSASSLFIWQLVLLLLLLNPVVFARLAAEKDVKVKEEKEKLEKNVAIHVGTYRSYAFVLLPQVTNVVTGDFAVQANSEGANIILFDDNGNDKEFAVLDNEVACLGTSKWTDFVEGYGRSIHASRYYIPDYRCILEDATTTPSMKIYFSYGGDVVDTYLKFKSNDIEVESRLFAKCFTGEILTPSEGEDSIYELTAEIVPTNDGSTELPEYLKRLEGTELLMKSTKVDCSGILPGGNFHLEYIYELYYYDGKVKKDKDDDDDSEDDDDDDNDNE